MVQGLFRLAGLFTVSEAAFVVLLMALVASSPMTASLTIRTTLLSVVSFSQPTYPTPAPTVAVFNALPAPFNVFDGCSTAPPTALPVAPTALPPVFNNELQIFFCFYVSCSTKKLLPFRSVSTVSWRSSLSPLCLLWDTPVP